MKTSKKILYVSLIIVVIVAITIIVCFFIYQNQFTTLYSKNNVFSIVVPNNLNFKTAFSEDTNFQLDIYSTKSETILYTSIIPKNSYEFDEIVKNDKNDMILNTDSIKNVSDIIKVNIKNYEAYQYEYKYISDYGQQHCFVVWIKTDQNIYILNIEISENSMEQYKEVITNIISSFTEI